LQAAAEIVPGVGPRTVAGQRIAERGDGAGAIARRLTGRAEIVPHRGVGRQQRRRSHQRVDSVGRPARSQQNLPERMSDHPIVGKGHGRPNCAGGIARLHQRRRKRPRRLAVVWSELHRLRQDFARVEKIAAGQQHQAEPAQRAEQRRLTRERRPVVRCGRPAIAGRRVNPAHRRVVRRIVRTERQRAQAVRPSLLVPAGVGQQQRQHPRRSGIGSVARAIQSLGRREVARPVGRNGAREHS